MNFYHPPRKQATRPSWRDTAADAVGALFFAIAVLAMIFAIFSL